MKRNLTILGLLLVTAAAWGCGRRVVLMDKPAVIAAEDYDRVFDAAVEELRDRRFVVGRRDRRFGRIDTEPLIASSVGEPWYSDNTTGGQVASSTLNLDRRIVHVQIEPDGPDGEAARYLLKIKVDMERRQRPPRQLTTSALGGTSVKKKHQTLDRVIVTERGREESYWKPIENDPHLEQRLVRAILDRAASTPQTRVAPEVLIPPFQAK